MKFVTFLATVFLFSFHAFAQNVGIGTNIPQSKLLIKGGLLLDSTVGGTPVSGPGTRMMWIPSKGAFRAGNAFTDHWDDVNIGNYSAALGNGSIAVGENSFATGNANYASGQSAVAMGSITQANGNQSVAMGYDCIAIGENSFVTGSQNYVTGLNAASLGYQNYITGMESLASGRFNEINAAFAVAFGMLNWGKANAGSVFGENNFGKSYAGAVFGMYNDTADANPTSPVLTNRLFEIGNGTNNSNRKNALTVLASGNIGVNTTVPVATFHVQNGSVLFDGTTGNTPVSGSGTRMMWIPAKGAFRAGSASSNYWDDINIGVHSAAFGDGNKASGLNSFAAGNFNIADGESSVVFGHGNQAGINYAMAIGSSNNAMGYYSFAGGNGNTSAGENDFAFGYQNNNIGIYSATFGSQNKITGQMSFVAGIKNISKSWAGTVVGSYNDTTDLSPNSPGSFNRTFQVGIGSNDQNRANALTVLQSGNIGIGEVSPTVPLNFKSTAGNKISLFGNGTNHFGIGTQASLLQLYTDASSSDIAFGYGNSNSFNENFRVKGNGDGILKGNITVQNGKGLIRSNDGTQQKKVTKDVLVNVSLPAGSSTSIAFTFPEAFSAAPDTYIGNVVSGAGGWAEVVMSLANITTTGGNLYIHNPRSVLWTPNFTVKIIAIGAQ